MPEKMISKAAGRLWSVSWIGHYSESSALQEMKARQARRK